LKLNSKEIHENFARFFEKPTREGLREFLQTNIGELDHCDFKKDWPSFPKVAKLILGLANSGGGCIILGVDDASLQPTGLGSAADKAEVEKGIRKFISNDISYLVLDFSYDTSEYQTIVGKKFQVVLVEDNPSHLPFICLAEGEDIRVNAIYVRRGTSTVEANHEELQKIINRRIETGYSSSRELALKEHIEQLKLLYAQLEKYYVRSGLLEYFASTLTINVQQLVRKEKNPIYPEEDLEHFIVRMIERKKQLIERVLGL
jgi:predicted HTH transcriptional regulator